MNSDSATKRWFNHGFSCLSEIEILADSTLSPPSPVVRHRHPAKPLKYTQLSRLIKSIAVELG